MALHLLAGSCDGGPCPTFYVDTDPARGVFVQGYVTSLPGLEVPAGEDIVQIPTDAWGRLLANLPWRMLAAATWTKMSRRKTRTFTPAGR